MLPDSERRDHAELALDVVPTHDIHDLNGRDWRLHPGGSCDPKRSRDTSWAVAIVAECRRPCSWVGMAEGHDGQYVCYQGVIFDQLWRSDPVAEARQCRRRHMIDPRAVLGPDLGAQPGYSCERRHYFGQRLSC